MAAMVMDPSKQIGKGVTASVYILDEEHIVKVFRDVIPYEEIRYEYDCANLVRDLGILTPRAEQIVETDCGTGIVYERVRGKTLSDMMQENKDRLFEYGKAYGALVRRLHDKRAPKTGIPLAKDAFKDYFSDCGDIISEKERKDVSELIDRVPERNSLLHGDIAPVNIMEENGTLYLIDVPTIKVGHPVFDLLQPYTFCRENSSFCEIYRNMSQDEKESDTGRFLSRFEKRYLNPKQSQDAWDGFLNGYFGQLSDRDKEAVEAVLHFYNSVKLMASVKMRNKFGEEVVRFLVDYGRDWLNQNMKMGETLDFSPFDQEQGND